MRRPWIVMLTSFALVLSLGGLAFAAGGVPFIDAGTDATTADSLEAGFPDLDDDFLDRIERDEPVKDKPVTDEPAKDEVKDEPVTDEPVTDEPVKDEPADDDHAKPAPPELVILYPSDGAKVDDEKMVFEGEVTPGTRVFAGKWEADVDEKGAWRIVLFLEPGTQTAKFHAESEGGYAEAKVTVTRIVADKPKEDAPTEDKPKVDETAYELVAHQVYGVCEAELPYDVFWGETKPGAHVLVWSEYGSAETYANEDGQFELRVDFPEAPYGQSFQVKVKSIEQKRYFEFTSYGNPPPGEDHGGEEGGAGA